MRDAGGEELGVEGEYLSLPWKVGEEREDISWKLGWYSGDDRRVEDGELDGEEAAGVALRNLSTCTFISSTSRSVDSVLSWSHVMHSFATLMTLLLVLTSSSNARILAKSINIFLPNRRRKS